MKINRTRAVRSYRRCWWRAVFRPQNRPFANRAMEDSHAILTVNLPAAQTPRPGDTNNWCRPLCPARSQRPAQNVLQFFPRQHDGIGLHAAGLGRLLHNRGNILRSQFIAAQTGDA